MPLIYKIMDITRIHWEYIQNTKLPMARKGKYFIFRRLAPEFPMLALFAVVIFVVLSIEIIYLVHLSCL